MDCNTTDPMDKLLFIYARLMLLLLLFYTAGVLALYGHGSNMKLYGNDALMQIDGS